VPWYIKVRGGRSYDGALHRLGLRPDSRNAADYIGFYSSKQEVAHRIADLKKLGIRGSARKYLKRKKIKPPKRRQLIEILPLRPTKPSAEILRIQETARIRLKADATKRRAEVRRQGQLLAEREAAERAHEAVRRIKGEV